jgi:hypothetical protein
MAMTVPPMKPLRATGLLVSILLAGCASSGGSADPLAYAASSCADLDVSIGETSKSISSVAIRHGKVDRLNVPFWVPGGDKAVAAVKARQTGKIERLEGQLQALRDARRARCL